MVGDEESIEHHSDGLILIEAGRITDCGAYDTVKQRLSDHAVTDYGDALIMPGLIDAHVHYPQTQMLGAYGSKLIEWLHKYTFVAEQQFADAGHAGSVADLFLQECLRAGTTTSAVYCTVHPESVDGFFQAAERRSMRMIAGKVMMDRNAPAALTDTAQSSYDESKALIDRWHGKGRLSYAITPRFAPTSTPAQLDAAGALWQEHPGTYMQTHISENPDELTWVKDLFPEQDSYLGVYSRFGLTGPRAIFGHGIYLSEPEWNQMAESGSAIAHCPTSNAFLGSGLFNLQRAKQPAAPGKPVRVSLATDVGAGTSLSMLKTMGDAYKISQFRHFPLSAPKAFYLATRGAAEALYLHDQIGSLAPGMEADLLVLDLKSTSIIDFRMQHCETLEEALFVQMIMADDRATRAVYVAGKLAYDRHGASVACDHG